jgi:hypothetical protein
MANIPVLVADGVTTVTYVAKSPSSGDKTPAVWTMDEYSNTVGFRPKFSVVTRNNGSNNARLFDGTLSYPVLVAGPTAGTLVKGATVTIDFHAVLPTNVEYAHVNDAFHQAGNLLVSDLIRDVAETGYAPS